VISPLVERIVRPEREVHRLTRRANRKLLHASSPRFGDLARRQGMAVIDRI
jgi:hypothetical protein